MSYPWKRKSQPPVQSDPPGDPPVVAPSQGEGMAALEGLETKVGRVISDLEAVQVDAAMDRMELQAKELLVELENIKPGMSKQDQMQAAAEIKQALKDEPAPDGEFDINQIKPGMSAETRAAAVAAINRALKG